MRGTLLTFNIAGVKIIGIAILLLILAGIHGSIQAIVNVDVLQKLTTINTDPALKIKYRFEANQFLTFELKCSSLEPVEWVFDDFTVKFKPATSLEWTKRKKLQGTSVFNYDAFIWLINYKFKEWPAHVEDQFVCRSVSNHSDNILLILRHDQNVIGNTTQRYIDVIEKPGDDKPLESTAKELEFAVNVTFNVIQSSRFGSFFQCKLNDGTLGRIKMEMCYTIIHYVQYNPAAECANTLRYLKTKQHNLNLTNLLTVPTEVLQEKENWFHLSDEYPGVAVCIDDTKPESPRVGAIQFFFSAAFTYSPPGPYTPYFPYPPPCPDSYPKAPEVYSDNESPMTHSVPSNSSLDEPYNPGFRPYVDPKQSYCRFPAYSSIYFSWAKVMPNQQVQLMLSKTFGSEEYYFPSDTLSIECQIPSYGFSDGSFLQISINGSVILEEAGFVRIFQSWMKKWNYTLSHGPGEYKFECIAPIWNTTEWANNSKTVRVLDHIAPDHNYTQISIQDSKSLFQVTLNCDIDIQGLPMFYQVSWYLDKEELPELQNQPVLHLGSIPATLQELLLHKISQLNGDPGYIKFSCKVDNRFGQKATKVFKIIYSGDLKGRLSLNPSWKENLATMLDQGPNKNGSAFINETIFIANILNEININIESENYIGTDINEIVNLVNRTAFYNTTIDISNQKLNAESAVGIFNSILGNKDVWDELETIERSDAATNILTTTDKILLELGRNNGKIQNSSLTGVVFGTDLKGPMKTIVGIEQAEVDQNSTLKLFFNSNNITLNSNEQAINSIELPAGWKSLAGERVNDSIPYVGISLRSDVGRELFKMETTNSSESDPGFLINSDIISFTLGKSSKTGIKNINFPGKGIEVQFSNRIPSLGYCGNYQRQVIEAAAPEPIRVNRNSTACVYWNDIDLIWSSQGCKLLDANETHTICECSHLTAFSVLVQPFVSKLEPHYNTLDTITRILCPISITCLLISIWILCIVKPNSCTLRVMNRITIHLCVCLAIANTMTLLFMDKTYFPMNSPFCYFSGAFTHYILLCAFLLMGMEAIYLYKLTVKVFQSGSNYSVIQYSLVYSIPALIVGSTMLIGLLNGNDVNGDGAYGNDIFCWLNGYYLIGAFVIPGGIVLLANLVLLSSALHHANIGKRRIVTLSYRNQSHRFIKKNDCKTTKKKLEILAAKLFRTKSVFALCVLLGVTWISGGFLLVCDKIVSQIAAYSFTLLNASQGIFILLFHCIGNTNIRTDLLLKIQSWTIYKEISLLVKPNNNTNSSSDELEPLKVLKTLSER